MMKLICPNKKCEDWEKGIAEMNAQQRFCSNQAAGPVYTTGIFTYCPYCGEELEEEE